jgi:hypothetical protein
VLRRKLRSKMQLSLMSHHSGTLSSHRLQFTRTSRREKEILLLSILMLSRLRPSRQRLYSQLLFVSCPQSKPATTKLAPASVPQRRTIMTDLPPTLQGPPTASIVPPGKCQFGAEAVSVPLRTRTKISPTSSVLRFGLPDGSKPLNLSTCACILATATINGESVTRKFRAVS